MLNLKTEFKKVDFSKKDSNNLRRIYNIINHNDMYNQQMQF